MRKMQKFDPKSGYILIFSAGALCLFLWSIFATYLFLTTQKEVVYVAMPDHGPSYILKDEILLDKKTDSKYFFAKYFLFNYTNFDKTTFSETIGMTRYWMTEDLWKTLQDNYISIKEKTENMDLTQVAKIIDIKEEADNVFSVLAESKVLVRGKVKKYEGKFTLEVRPAPYIKGFNENGFEVSSMKEVWSEI